MSLGTGLGVRLLCPGGVGGLLPGPVAEWPGGSSGFGEEVAVGATGPEAGGSGGGAAPGDSPSSVGVGDIGTGRAGWLLVGASDGVSQDGSGEASGSCAMSCDGCAGSGGSADLLPTATLTANATRAPVGTTNSSGLRRGLRCRPRRCGLGGPATSSKPTSSVMP
jgi:hypothetical protein